MNTNEVISHPQPSDLRNPSNVANDRSRLPSSTRQFNEVLVRFVKFCLVGGTGVIVDMTVLGLLADPRFFGWNVTLSKVCAAEIAMMNNFVWNELWTFRLASMSSNGARSRLARGGLRRLLLFNAICGIGIGIAVIFLHVFHRLLGWNLYLSNMLAIGLVTVWNFGINTRFNWVNKIQKL